MIFFVSNKKITLSIMKDNRCICLVFEKIDQKMTSKRCENPTLKNSLMCSDHEVYFTESFSEDSDGSL